MSSSWMNWIVILLCPIWNLLCRNRAVLQEVCPEFIGNTEGKEVALQSHSGSLVQKWLMNDVGPHLSLKILSDGRLHRVLVHDQAASLTFKMCFLTSSLYVPWCRLRYHRECCWFPVKFLSNPCLQILFLCCWLFNCVKSHTYPFSNAFLP